MAQALLVVDLQHGLFAQAPAHDIDGVIGRINVLAQRARSAGAPVFLIQHEAPGSPLAHGSPGWQLDARLAPAADDIRIGKTTSARLTDDQRKVLSLITKMDLIEMLAARKSSRPAR